MTLAQRREALESAVAAFQSCAVAFSGGVDSSLLLAVCHRTLGDKVVALTAETPYTARWERNRATELAAGLGVRHAVVRMDPDIELDTNPPSRCLLCKRRIFGTLLREAHNYGCQVLVDGSNADDVGEYRPGMQAAHELGVRSPLLETGLTKADVRELARAEGLAAWDQPAFSCLLTRLPHNVRVTESDLRRIERSELALMELGFPSVRVRHHGDVARIEVPEQDINRLVSPGLRARIVAALADAGYRYVSLDLAGYRTGNMDAL